jgi:RNase P/RNase MRP subunit POP5
VYNIPKTNKRQRYIGFKLISESDESIDKKDLFNEIQKMCRNKYNKYSTDMGLRLIRFDGMFGIIKCNHIEKENTISLLNSIGHIKSKYVKIETLYTSGTIKSLNKRIKNLTFVLY